MNSQVDINTIQYIAVAGSIGFFVFIIELVRKKNIKEEYSLLWIFFAIVFIVLSIWRGGLELIARLIGINYPPAALFLILLLAVILILIQFSVVISRLSENIKSIAQEMGILKMRFEDIQKKAKSEEQTKK